MRVHSDVEPCGSLHGEKEIAQTRSVQEEKPTRRNALGNWERVQDDRTTGSEGFGVMLRSKNIGSPAAASQKESVLCALSTNRKMVTAVASVRYLRDNSTDH